MSYILNYTKWNTLFEQNELDKTAGDRLNKTTSIDKRLNYIQSASNGTPGKEEFEEYKNKMWVIVFGQLIGYGPEMTLAKTSSGTDKNYIDYWIKTDPTIKYPFYGNFSNLKIPHDWIKQSSDLFNQRYWSTFNQKVKDPIWIKYFVEQFNKLFGSSIDKPSETVRQIQSYIKDQITDKQYVKDNGTPGRDFIDGVWGPVSATAWLIFSKSIDPSITIKTTMFNLCKSNSKNIVTPDKQINSTIITSEKVITGKNKQNTDN